MNLLRSRRQIGSEISSFLLGQINERPCGSNNEVRAEGQC